MVEETWKVAIEAQDRQLALAGAPAGKPLVYQLPSSRSLKIDLQTREAVSLGFCFMLFYQIYDIDYTRNYTEFKLQISTIRGRLADGAHRTVFWSKHLDVHSQTELRIQVKDLLFDDAYLSKVIEDKKS